MSKEEVKSSDNSFGTASFILGLLSTVFFFTIVPPVIFAVLGIIFGVLQRKKQKSNMALFGIILSILGLVLSFLFIWIILGAVATVKICMEDPTRQGCEAIMQYLSQNQGANPYA